MNIKTKMFVYAVNYNSYKERKSESASQKKMESENKIVISAILMSIFHLYLNSSSHLLCSFIKVSTKSSKKNTITVKYLQLHDP